MTRPDGYAAARAKGAVGRFTPRQRVRHVIADISYSLDRLECSCGAVMRADFLAGEWPLHRKAEQQPQRSLGQSVQRMGRATPNWSLGRRK